MKIAPGRETGNLQRGGSVSGLTVPVGRVEWVRRSRKRAHGVEDIREKPEQSIRKNGYLALSCSVESRIFGEVLPDVMTWPWFGDVSKGILGVPWGFQSDFLWVPKTLSLISND